MVPTHPTADFILAQAHLTLAGLQNLLHTMPLAAHIDQLPQLDRFVGVAQAIGGAFLLIERARHHLLQVLLQRAGRSAQSRLLQIAAADNTFEGKKLLAVG